MDLFDQTIEKACQEKQIPGVVLVAGSNTGDFRYAKCFGASSLEEENRPMKMGSTMWMASCTKVLTTIAVMQCVEKGLLALDDDVTSVLPEVKDLPILLGFDEEKGGKPILRKREKVMTLRHLLTHSSGMCYDIFNPLLRRYQAQRNSGKDTTDLTVSGVSRSEQPIAKKFAYPLIFEPGEGWEYSVGIDWAGQMVERKTSMTLDQYFQTHLFSTLGIKDRLTFHPLANPSVSSNLCAISWRHGGVNKYGSTDNPTGVCEPTSQVFWDAHVRENHGGAGIFGDMASYFVVLEAMMKGDERILKGETWREMFRPQLEEKARRMLNQMRSIKEVNDGFGALDMDVTVDYGLGGIMNLSQLKTGRRPFSLAWGGYPNLTWWVDPTAGMAGIYGSQLCPPGDPKTGELSMEWERLCYAEKDKARRGSISRL